MRAARRHLLTTCATAVAVGTLALLFAACGSSAGPGVASLGSTTTTNAVGTASPSPFQGMNQEYQYTLSYAECMRTHGVPNFPDPTRNAQSIHFSVYGNSDSPQSSSAHRTCEHLLPDNGGLPTASQAAAETTKLLQWAHCIRSHGVPNFPDPRVTSNSRMFGVSVPPASLQNSPQFRRAEKSCPSTFDVP
jgi:hypothetical protein